MESKPIVLAFVSAKGGVGKTTLATNVATGLHRRGHRVLAVDLDPQNAMRLHLGMDSADGAGFAREGLTRQVLFNSPAGVFFAPFGQLTESDLEDFEEFLRCNPKWLVNSLSGLAPLGFDYVVLDTPPGPSEYLTQALSVSDHMLAILHADAASYVTVNQLRTLIEEAPTRPPHSDVHVVLNQLPYTGRLAYLVRKSLADDATLPLAPVAVHRDPRIPVALAFQEPVVTYAANSTASMDIEYFVDWILDLTRR